MQLQLFGYLLRQKLPLAGKELKCIGSMFLSFICVFQVRSDWYVYAVLSALPWVSLQFGLYVRKADLHFHCLHITNSTSQKSYSI